MEKGSYTTPPVPTSFTRELDERVKSIPLPSELPKGIDFKDLPSNAIKSSTLDGLISQNEDLMARLSIALRRINEIEDNTSRFEQENQALRTRVQTLRDQFLIVQEKEKMSSSRASQLHDESTRLREQLEKLEKHYADLFVQTQSFQRSMRHLERYRARVRKAAPPIQRLARIAVKLEKEIVESRTRLQNQLNDARNEIESLRGKAFERDRLFEEKIKIENDRLYDQRQFVMLREEAQKTIETLESENANMRVQIKELLIDNESKTQQLNQLQTEVPHLQDQIRQLSEQVESLQALWSHKQKEFEHSEEKNKSLQKLNQTISLTINQQRKQIQRLESELETEQFTAQEKIKVLQTEIDLLRNQKEEGGGEKL